MTDRDNVRPLRPDLDEPFEHDGQLVIGAHALTVEAGITYRQLDFWTRCGYLLATGEAHLGDYQIRPRQETA